jgi:hypothetical protein
MMSDAAAAATGLNAGEIASPIDPSSWRTVAADTEPAEPVRLRELAAVLLIVALSDITIYRGHGFAGVALLLVVCPFLLATGCAKPSFRAVSWVIAGMLLLLAGRLIWLGSALGVASGVALLVALAVALQGRTPHVVEVVLSAIRTAGTGCLGLARYGQWLARFSPLVSSHHWLGVFLPLAALALFGGLFVLANPDLVKWVIESANSMMRWLDAWLMRTPFHVGEVIFWFAVAWFVVGLLRPYWPAFDASLSSGKPSRREPLPTLAMAETPWYAPVRNTLLSVIALFAVYLVFEFQTLWFREFPKGFYYGGYAHEGAAWLTTALAFATLLLSMIFRGHLLEDNRIRKLRKLAWVWSAENMILALTVFNRLHIYVAFNGMTRMRMVALFGTVLVVVGFLLVVWKILKGHSFPWLLRAQLWALAITVYLFALTPVDAIVQHYNVRHVMAGELPPVVQITEHPINAEGILMLEPLADCQDPIIREGIRAMLAKSFLEAEATAKKRERLGWTTIQIADDICQKQLEASREKWKDYLDASKRAELFNKTKSRFCCDV